jgi:hypothetical protein
MALLAGKAGRVPPATAPFHHAYYFATELGAWAPILTLLALTVIAGFILWSKVGGY